MTLTRYDSHVKSAGRWLGLIAIILVLSVVSGTNWYLVYEETVPWWDNFVMEALYWLSWLIFVPAIVALLKWLERKRFGMLLITIVHFPVGLAFSMAHKAIVVALWWFLLPLALVPKSDSLFSAVHTRIYRGIHLGLLGYAMIVVVLLAYSFYKKKRQSELRAAHLESLLTRSELSALKMQLQPHFLFNTLNSIAGLMHGNIDLADEMLARLGSFLRLTLETTRSQLVLLKNELDFVRHYLAIEEIRFQERLRIEWQVDEKMSDEYVPSLILQPLVENAIKHGIRNTVGEAILRISVSCEDGVLVLGVFDNGPGMVDSPPTQASGIGLANTRKRLDEMYGSSASLSLEKQPGGFCSRIRLPRGFTETP